MYLIDTSAWVDYLRDAPSRASTEVERLLTSKAEVMVTEPITMELLAGAPTTHVFTQLETLTNSLPPVHVDSLVDYHSAATIYRVAREQGKTARKLLDCLIAAIAIRGGLTLVHKDADFEAIAACTALDAVSLR